MKAAFLVVTLVTLALVAAPAAASRPPFTTVTKPISASLARTMTGVSWRPAARCHFATYGS